MKARKQKYETLTLRLTDDEWLAVKRLAKEKGMSVSAHIRDSVNQLVARLQAEQQGEFTPTDTQGGEGQQ